MFVILAVFNLACATHIQRNGLTVDTRDPRALNHGIADPSADYTGGVDPAIAANVRNNPNATVYRSGNTTVYVGNSQGPQGFQTGVWENYAYYDIMVEINNSALPGFQPLTILVKHNSYATLKLLPGDYTGKIYSLNSSNRKLIAHVTFKVDGVKSDQIAPMANIPCDFYYFWR